MNFFGKTAVFPGGFGHIGGNAGRADLAGLGPIGLIFPHRSSRPTLIGRLLLTANRSSGYGP